MLIERRRKVRINQNEELDWVSDFDGYALEDWDDESLYKINPTPWQVLVSSAIIAGLCAYTIGSIIF